jgi:VanZ family protein
MAALFVLSSIPNPPSLPRAASDKLIHAALYAGLGAVTIRALAEGRWHELRLAHVLGAVLIATIYGAFDEFHQSFVAGRRSDFADLRADAIGASVAAFSLWLWGILTKTVKKT